MPVTRGPTGHRPQPGQSYASPVRTSPGRDEPDAYAPTAARHKRSDKWRFGARPAARLPDGAEIHVRPASARSKRPARSERDTNAKFHNTVAGYVEELGGRRGVARHHQEQPAAPPGQLRRHGGNNHLPAQEVAGLHGIERQRL